jgi:hypothetical protein
MPTNTSNQFLKESLSEVEKKKERKNRLNKKNRERDATHREKVSKENGKTDK